MKHEDSCNNTTIPYISLFSGYEGIGIGIKRVFGRNLRTIAYCEREAFPCANLVDKIEQGRLDAAPIFTDVHTFPWKQYAPFMANGIMSFGFPCQPVSCAGKRKVAEDERWLFDVCADGIEILRPGIIFAENVEGLLSAKMPNGKPVIAHIFERLEKIHYTVEAGLFSAAEVGAPHQRKRVFILAYSQESRKFRINGYTYEVASHDGCGMPELVGSSQQELADTSQQGPQRRGQLGEQATGRETTKSIGHDTAGCYPQRWPARPGEPQHPWEEPRVLADTSRQLQYRCRSTGTPGRGEPPNQGERKIKPGLGGEPNESPHRLDPNRNRIDRLRLLGNGVVPATAEKAFITLANRIINPGAKTRTVEIQGDLFD